MRIEDWLRNQTNFLLRRRKYSISTVKSGPCTRHNPTQVWMRLIRRVSFDTMKLLPFTILALLSAVVQGAVETMLAEVDFNMTLSEVQAAVDACLGFESEVASGMENTAVETVEFSGYTTSTDFEYHSNSDQNERRNLQKRMGFKNLGTCLGNCKSSRIFCLWLCQRKRRRLNVEVPAGTDHRKLEQQVCGWIQEDVANYVADLANAVERIIARQQRMPRKKKDKARECASALVTALVEVDCELVL